MRYGRDRSPSGVDQPGIPAALPCWFGTKGTGAPLILILLASLTVMFGLATQMGTAAAAGCTNEAFRTGFGADLPDCRAYEQVTPVDKKGAIAAGIPDHVISAEVGPGITFFSPNGTGVPFTGVGSTGDYPTLLATRGSESWSTQSLLAPQALGVKSQFLGITPDLRYGLVQSLDTDYEHPGFGLGLYLIDTTTDSVTTIVPAPQNEAESTYAFDGASEDGSKIFFETAAALTPEARGSDSLYMWERATGQVSLVGVLPDSEGGEEPEAGSFGGAYKWFGEQEPYSGGALGGNAVDALHAISPDGDQIYFTAAETGQLYLRLGLNGPNATTLRVSEPNTGFSDSSPPKPAAFQGATPDGSHAFFLSAGKLAAGASTGAAEEGRDLYRFDENSPPGERLTDLTPDASAETPNGAEVQGLLGVSTDGEAGYLVARGVLAPGGEPGRENLYRFENREGGVRLIAIAVLSNEPGNFPEDQFNWTSRNYNGSIYEGKTSRVSADGDVLVFSSQEPLTGYEPTGPGCTAPNGASGPNRRCSQIFKYEADSASLTCLSCSPTGEPPLGAATFESALAFSKGVQFPERASSVTFANNLSSEGNHVFFQTAQPLVAADTNGVSECAQLPIEAAPQTPEFECQDVYEWEAAGTPGGTCTRDEVNGGCLYLLSSGQSGRPSYFAGASADGSNVYILTTSQLVTSDRDRTVDVYNVGVGGGLASQQGVPRESCTGEGCLGPVGLTPPALSSGSAQIDGPRNQKPRAHKKHKKPHKHRKKKKRQGGVRKSKSKLAGANGKSAGRGSRGSSGRGGAK